MARCEDYPCCGHYDESTGPGGGSWCPDENGKYPPLNLPTCRYCGYYLDFEDPHDCGGGYEEEEDIPESWLQCEECSQWYDDEEPHYCEPVTGPYVIGGATSG